MTDVTPPLPFYNRQRPPAPVPPRDRLGPISAYRTLRANSIALWREEVYQALITVDRAPYGEIVVVNAPDAIRRVPGIEVMTVARMTLRPARGLPMRLHRR
jgi:hypothetical protein